MTASAAPVRPAAPRLVLALVILVWGINWPVMKVAVGGISPDLFAVLRLMLAAATLFAITAATNGIRLPARRDLPIILHLGILQMGLYLVLVSNGVSIVGAGRAAILTYATPIWVAPMSVLLLKERLTRNQMAGLACAMLGIAILFNPFEFDWQDMRALGGNMMLLSAAFLWALATIHLRVHRWEGSLSQSMPWCLVVAAVVAIAKLALTAGGSIALPMTISPSVLAAIAFNGFISTPLGFWLWNLATPRLPPVVSATAGLGVPVVGVAASVLCLGEPVSPAMLLGGLFIVASLALTAMSSAPAPRQRDRRPSPADR